MLLFNLFALPLLPLMPESWETDLEQQVQQLRAAHSYLKDVAARVEVEQARRVAQAAEAGEKVAGQCEAPT